MNQVAVFEPLESIGWILITVNQVRVAGCGILPDVTAFALEVETTLNKMIKKMKKGTVSFLP